MRLLIIEDQLELREFLVQSMRENLFVVDSTGDGEEGSKLARTNEYDLILLDYNLPGKTGQQVCHDIRSAKKTVPILILSVHADTANKVNLLESGADDYLTKPFSFEELRARIRALLRRPKEITKFRYTLDDLVLDCNNHICTRGKKSIHLTHKEFMLLAFLLKHVDTVVSRAAILEHVWDIHADPFTNSIETHIGSLRKKIDMGGKVKLIHTISGSGYKITKRP